MSEEEEAGEDLTEGEVAEAEAMARSEDREETELVLKLAGAFHEYGLSLPTRTLYVGSDLSTLEGTSGVDAKMAEQVIKNLHVLESLSSEPVRVLMNNPGGDVYDGLAIFDAVAQSPCDVEVICRGYAMSMGSVILQAADHRVMGPRAVQMIHYGTFGFSGHSKTGVKVALEEERVNAWMEQMYLERIQKVRPFFTLEDLKKMLDHDTYLTAQESVSLGLCDEVR